jgi:predicted SAM-dependent methyltransferase
MTRKLHIGGQVRVEGWEVLNANDAPYVDHVCNAKDLSQFENNSFYQIYASHVVEHFDYKDELVVVLKEWQRVLAPGGSVYISVPDMDILAELFLAKDRLSPQDRYQVMRMIFGGHIDKFDYHLVGLNAEFLAIYLNEAGFINVGKVDEFGLFEDASSMKFAGVPISLNVVADKPTS